MAQLDSNNKGFPAPPPELSLLSNNELKVEVKKIISNLRRFQEEFDRNQPVFDVADNSLTTKDKMERFLNAKTKTQELYSNKLKTEFLPSCLAFSSEMIRRLGSFSFLPITQDLPISERDKRIGIRRGADMVFYGIPAGSASNVVDFLEAILRELPS